MTQVVTHAPCAGRGCNNEAVTIILLRYLNLRGPFCAACADSLIADGLATEEKALGAQ
jgi:hypothetical protein